MRSKIVTAALLLPGIFAFNTARAQVSLKASLLAPRGDFGLYFKKTMAGELSLLAATDHWRSRFSFVYAKLTPRLDTFPVATIAGVAAVTPGTKVYDKMPMYYLRSDFSYAFVSYKGFSVWGGTGLIIGQIHQYYDERYDGVSNEVSDEDHLIIGLPLVATVQYRVNTHFDVFAEVINNRVMALSSNVSSNLQHNTYSIGANYFVRERDKKSKKKHKSKTWF